MVSKWTRHSGRGTLHTNEVWEGDRRRTTLQLDGERDGDAAPVSPDLVLWGDPDHGVLVGQDVLLPDAPAQATAESLHKALTRPIPGSGRPRQPRKIRVRSREIAEAIRSVTEPLGIPLEITERLPFLDDVFRGFEARFGSPTHLGYLDATDLPEPLLSELFAAAASFFRAQPWQQFEDGDPILLECEEWTPPDRYAVLVGDGVEARGVAVFQSWRDLLSFSSAAPQAAESDTLLERIPAVVLMFTPTDRLGKHRTEEARKRRWSLASHDAYPVVWASGPGRESRWPTPGEVRTLIAVLRAMVPFLKNLRRLRPVFEAQGYFSETRHVRVGEVEQEVDLFFPMPATVR